MARGCRPQGVLGSDQDQPPSSPARQHPLRSQSLDQRDCVEGKKALGSPFRPLIFPPLLLLSSALLYATLAPLGLTTAQTWDNHRTDLR